MPKRLSGNISESQVKSKCLIGSKIYNKYLLVVKIVLAFIFIILERFIINKHVFYKAKK